MVVRINRSVWIDEESKEFPFLCSGEKKNLDNNSGKCLDLVSSSGHAVPLYDVTAP